MTMKARGMPLMLGRAPTVHRSGYNQVLAPGPFKKTRPAGAGGSPDDAPYFFTKMVSHPGYVNKDPLIMQFWTWMHIGIFFGSFAMFVLSDNVEFIMRSRHEAFRRRRERRERLEMECLGISEDDVDPKLVQEIDQLYVKGRNTSITSYW